MLQPRPEDKRMCETSESDERLFSEEEILPINLEIGRRLLEVFGNQAISNITFRLRSTASEINDILDGRTLPSCEILLGVRKLTGVSIDWLLTGEGEKFPDRRAGTTVLTAQREPNFLRRPKSDHNIRQLPLLS